MTPSSAFRLGMDPMPDWFCNAKSANKVITHNCDGRWRGGPDIAYIHTPKCIVVVKYGDLVTPAIFAERARLRTSLRTAWSRIVDGSWGT